MIRNLRGRERGMSFWPFVVALLALLVVGYLFYETSQERDDLKRRLETQTTAATTERDQRLAFDARLNELTEVTGFSDAFGKPDKDKMQEAKKQFLAKWRERLTIEFDTDKYAPTGEGGRIEKLTGPRVRVSYLPTAAEMAEAPSFESLLPMLEAAVARMQVDIKRAFEMANTEIAAKTTLVNEQRAAIQQKDQRISELTTSQQALQASFDEQGRQLREEISTAQAQLQQTQTESEQYRTESEAARGKLTGELNQKVGEITSLVQRDKPFVSEGPDGEVLAAGSGVAIVNRGKKDMLMGGTTFTVLGRKKGGDLYRKGSIKVTTVDDNSARGRIVEENPADPIGQGDLIQSAVYSPNRQLRFHLVGEFRKMGKSQAEARLKALGAMVDPEVTTQTHYLVIGSPGPGAENIEETPAYKRASEYGTQILTEDELASFTRY